MKTDSSTTTKDSSASSARPGQARTFFNGFLLGVLVTGVVTWFIVRQGRKHSEAQQQFQQASSNVTEATAEALYQAGEAFKAQLETLDLKTDQVREELARTGKVVRRSARELAAQVTDAASDARVTAAIKTRLATDRELSMWSISVSTTEGHVTLDGTVSSADHIAKAVALAMEVDNVRDVTANLKVEEKPAPTKPDQKP